MHTDYRDEELERIAKLVDKRTLEALTVVVKAARRKARGKPKPNAPFGDIRDGWEAYRAACMHLATLTVAACDPDVLAKLARDVATLIKAVVTATSPTHTISASPNDSISDARRAVREIRDPAKEAYAQLWAGYVTRLQRLDMQVLPFLVQWFEDVAEATPFLTQDTRATVLGILARRGGFYGGSRAEQYEGKNPDQMARFLIRRALLLLTEGKALINAEPSENIPAMAARWRELAATRNAAATTARTYVN